GKRAEPPRVLGPALPEHLEQGGDQVVPQVDDPGRVAVAGEGDGPQHDGEHVEREEQREGSEAPWHPHPPDLLPHLHSSPASLPQRAARCKAPPRLLGGQEPRAAPPRASLASGSAQAGPPRLARSCRPLGDPWVRESGETEEEALVNIREAIVACLEVRAEQGLPLTVRTVEVDVAVA